jgi:hypothetical protein
LASQSGSSHSQRSTATKQTARLGSVRASQMVITALSLGATIDPVHGRVAIN